AVEALDAQSLKRARIELVWQTALIPQCERITVVKHDVRIGSVFQPSVRSGSFRGVRIRPVHQARPKRALRFLLGEKSFRANPSISISRLSVLELDRMHHSVAVEPVITAAGLEDRIWTIAQIDAIQVFWNFPNNGQIVSRDFG